METLEHVGRHEAAEFNPGDLVASFAATVARVISAPAAFFRGIESRGAYGPPLAYAALCTLLSTVFSGALTLAFGTETLGKILASIVAAPFIGAIVAAISAGIVHLLVMLLARDGNAGYRATLRASAYAMTAQLVAWVPFVGAIVAPVGGLVLFVIGLRELHGMTTGRAAAAALIPAAIFFLLFVALFVFVINLIAANLG